MSSSTSWSRRLVVAAALLLAAAAAASAQGPATPLEPLVVTKDTPNEVCLGCHGVAGFAVPKGTTGEGPKRQLSLNAAAFGGSAHGKQPCVACHADVTELPHKKGVERAVDCTECHVETAKAEAAKPKAEQRNPEIARVAHQVGDFLGSVHAKPRKEDATRPNATCIDCHDAHYVFPMASAAGKAFRLTTPDVCGRCHAKERQDYGLSVHGAAVLRFGRSDGATCADCHTAHRIAKPTEDPVKLAITENCGGCHEQEYRTYRATYHGQIEALGYTHTAKCFDCHENHATLKVADVNSKANPSRRLATCQQCHKTATAGFVGFYPHGNTHDFARYPTMWIASKFMILLLAGVFAFFWTHSALWFYREWRERRDGSRHVLVDADGDPVVVPGVPAPWERKHVARFGRWWRLAHLVLALAVMFLVLTGTTLLYADSFWAPTVMRLLGGPIVAGVIHRVSAATFAVLFFGHILYALWRTLVVDRRTFRWFGPYSLLPRWQDFKDMWAMAKWFVGKGPRPAFDHWTYWEKFDYWAPFWGMVIIGLSGLTLWFREAAAIFLPGWAFNVATILHGEEAFLAAVFLFTVHYFNCHFRPSKLPQDIQMFTGTVPLHEFIEERAVEYRRLVETGQIEKYLVDPPSRGRTRAAQALGAVLIAVGLGLLALVLLGFWQTVLFG